MSLLIRAVAAAASEACRPGAGAVARWGWDSDATVANRRPSASTRRARTALMTSAQLASGRCFASKTIESKITDRCWRSLPISWYSLAGRSSLYHAAGPPAASPAASMRGVASPDATHRPPSSKSKAHSSTVPVNA